MSTPIFPEPLVIPVARPDGLDEQYWAGTRAHELRVQRCDNCETWRWAPEWICHVCHSFEMAWLPVEPTGELFSWSRIWHPTHPQLAAHVPYLVVVVELPQASGIRMLGNLTGPADQSLKVGMPLAATFEDHDNCDPPFTLVQWSASDA